MNPPLRFAWKQKGGQDTDSPDRCHSNGLDALLLHDGITYL